MKTLSPFHNKGRQLTGAIFDHTVLILEDGETALHIAYPEVKKAAAWTFCIETREPHVIWLKMTQEEKLELIKEAETLIGSKYDTARMMKFALWIKNDVDTPMNKLVCSHGLYQLFKKHSLSFKMAINKHYDTFGLRKLGMFSNDDFYHLSLLEPDIYSIIGDGRMPSRLPHFEVTES